MSLPRQTESDLGLGSVWTCAHLHVSSACAYTTPSFKHPAARLDRRYSSPFPIIRLVSTAATHLELQPLLISNPHHSFHLIAHDTPLSSPTSIMAGRRSMDSARSILSGPAPRVSTESNDSALTRTTVRGIGNTIATTTTTIRIRLPKTSTPSTPSPWSSTPSTPSPSPSPSLPRLRRLRRRCLWHPRDSTSPG